MNREKLKKFCFITQTSFDDCTCEVDYKYRHTCILKIGTLPFENY